MAKIVWQDMHGLSEEDGFFGTGMVHGIKVELNDGRIGYANIYDWQDNDRWTLKMELKYRDMPEKQLCVECVLRAIEDATKEAPMPKLS